MKKVYLFLVLCLTIQYLSGQKAPLGDIWLHMISTGQPAATKYLGDQLNPGNTWYINFEIGQASWYQSDAGLGQSNSDPSAWTWRTANWYANGSGSNKMVRSDFGDFRFTATGNWYFAGRAKAESGDAWHYANTDGWGNASAFSPIYYFSVIAINNPGSQAATLNGANPTSQIDLSWSKNAQDHNVMIVRKKSYESWTEPTQGTTYTVGSTIGSGIVVYNSNGTSFSNTGLNSSSGYDYKFYSENFSYYSPGVTAGTVTTHTAATDYFRSGSYGNWDAAATWESSSNNSNWVNASQVPEGTANVTTIRNGHTVTVNSAVTANSISIESGGVLSVASGKSLTINGVLTNSGTYAGIVIENNGSLITNNTVSGQLSIKREIASDNNWHFLSSPVSGQNICDGNFAPTTSNFNTTTGLTYDFYKWSEAVVAGNLNWINLKNTDYTLNTAEFGATPQFEMGRGYLVAYSPSYAGGITKTFAGNIISVNDTLTLGTSGNTWNLVGNPYTAAINWDNVTKTSLDGGYYYVYNENKAGGAGYESYLDPLHCTSGANGKISATQGFFVKASGNSLVIPASARVHDVNWMKNNEGQFNNRLKITFGNSSNYDETYLLFEGEGTAARDFYDADKLMSMDASIPQAYSIVNPDIPLAINSLPFSLDEVAVQLGTTFPGSSGYEITLSGLESFPVQPSVLLEDTRLNYFHDIVAEPSYAFTAEALENPNRFILHFLGVTSTSELAGQNEIVAWGLSGAIQVVNGSSFESKVTIFDLSGRLVTTGQIEGGASRAFSLAGNPGIYLVNVRNDQSAHIQKVLVK